MYDSIRFGLVINVVDDQQNIYDFNNSRTCFRYTYTIKYIFTLSFDSWMICNGHGNNIWHMSQAGSFGWLSILLIEKHLKKNMHITVGQNKVWSTDIYCNIIFFSIFLILSRFLELVTIKFESILKTIVCIGTIYRYWLICEPIYI